jgi:hypothetical protein
MTAWEICDTFSPVLAHRSVAEWWPQDDPDEDAEGYEDEDGKGVNASQAQFSDCFVLHGLWPPVYPLDPADAQRFGLLV